MFPRSLNHLFIQNLPIKKKEDFNTKLNDVYNAIKNEFEIFVSVNFFNFFKNEI